MSVTTKLFGNFLYIYITYYFTESNFVKAKICLFSLMTEYDILVIYFFDIF